MIGMSEQNLAELSTCEQTKEQLITDRMQEYGDLVCRLINEGVDTQELHRPDSECMRLSNEIDELLGAEDD